MAYVVDLDAIRRLPETGAGAIDQIIDKCRDTIDNFNYQRTDEIADGELTVEHAMRDIVAGHPRDDMTHVYGYAIEVFCEYYGRFLQNDKVMPWNRGYDKLDEQLRAAGVTDGLPLAMVAWDPPLPVPGLTDFPRIGTFDNETCCRAAAQYAAAMPALAESEYRSSALQMLGWFRQACTNDRGVVVFYY
jgi:hypothetical protein